MQSNPLHAPQVRFISGWHLQRTKKAPIPECSWFAPSKSFTRNLVFAGENERNEPDSPRPSHGFGKQTENILFKAGCKAKRAVSPFDEGVAPPENEKSIPFGMLRSLEAPPGIGPGNKGFADLCLTAWLWRLMKLRARSFSCPSVERITGLEPATSTLARSRSTK